jgi:DNA (cytosine-5)-methyltransferase 1
MTEVACIDLFCGAGGLTYGLTSAGIPVVAGFDVDPACRHPYETNNDARFIERDVSAVSPAQLQQMFGEAKVRVLAGCAPCQPFSTYSQRYDTVGTPRWALLKHFSRLVRGTRPEIVTMENVPTVDRHGIYVDFVSALDRLGYTIWHDVVDCSAYGLPQQRRRKVLLASLLGDIELIAPNQRARPKTVRSAIHALQPLTAGESSPTDPLHAAATLSNLNLRRIRASAPGGTWRDWPSHLRAECHRRPTGKTYPSVYGRMEWDAPAPTLTTQYYGFGNGRFGHPEQDRAISLREGAILQGFPRAYSFLPRGARVQFRMLGRMIGNAVPVTLGRVVGRSIRQHLDCTASDHSESRDDVLSRKPA